jgi:hypothetical protein
MRVLMDGYAGLGWWVLGFSLLTFVGSLVGIPLLIVRLPADYVLRPEPAPDTWPARHPAVRLSVLVAKNLLGLALVIAGIVMLFLPGQGILAILIGLPLLDLPGKRALERRLIRSPAILPAVNAIRAQAGQPPLRVE